MLRSIKSIRFAPTAVLQPPERRCVPRQGPLMVDLPPEGVALIELA